MAAISMQHRAAPVHAYHHIGTAYDTASSYSSDRQTSSITAKTTAAVFAAHERQSILDNYDMETAGRTRELQQQMSLAASSLRRQLNAESLRVSTSSARTLTAGSLVREHGADIVRAALVVAEAQRQQHGSNQAEDIAEEIQQTIKQTKRKRQIQDGESSGTTSIDQHSPTKPRGKMQRTQPEALHSKTPSKYLASAGLPKSASRTALAAANANSGKKQRIPSGRHIPSSASKRELHGGSGASNYVYRARPSMQPFHNPRLPQTPKLRSTNAFGSAYTNTATAGTGTARRMPKRNESIQAYSMNGSPLGILDLAVDEVPPDNVAPLRSNAGAEEDWELLQSQEHSQQHQKLSRPVAASAPNGSPNKLFRKASSTSLFSGHSGTSAFKAAIMAGASRAAAVAVSSTSSSTTGSSRARLPTQEQFTFAPPALPESAGSTHEEWLAKLRGDMEGMRMSDTDKSKLEERLMEMLGNSFSSQLR